VFMARGECARHAQSIAGEQHLFSTRSKLSEYAPSHGNNLRFDINPVMETSQLDRRIPTQSLY
jgi:hypothetical protein